MFCRGSCAYVRSSPSQSHSPLPVTGYLRTINTTEWDYKSQNKMGRALGHRVILLVPVTHGEDVLAGRMESLGVPAECSRHGHCALGHRVILLAPVTHGEDVLAGRMERDTAVNPIEERCVCLWCPCLGRWCKALGRDAPVVQWPGKAACPDITGWWDHLSPGFLADELIKYSY